jgi:serine/threonine protein kinase
MNRAAPMTRSAVTVVARRWLILSFSASAVGLVMTAVTGILWLAWLALLLVFAITIAAYLSLGSIDKVRRALLTTEPFLDEARPELDVPPVTEEDTPDPSSSRQLRALMDSSVDARDPHRTSPMTGRGEPANRPSRADRGDMVKTMRVARSLGAATEHGPDTEPESLDSQIYELVEKLGAGNMGEIWRGRHKRLGRQCAVKILRKKAADWEDEQRFEREARVMATLSSPHTVEIYDFGIRQDGSFYYVMELLDGIDLQKLIERFGPLPATRVVHILRQACHSLQEAHAAGLVHRDLKPANMILCRYGQDVDMLKLVDFGLAKEEAPIGEAGKKLTRMRTVLGTAAYLAPESRAGSVHVDHRADLYGLACIAFWLLTGRLVFSEKNPIKMIHAHIAEAPPRVSEHASGVPAALDALIDRCLAKAPEDRIQDARTLRAALDELCRETYWTDDEARQWWTRYGEAI